MPVCQKCEKTILSRFPQPQLIHFFSRQKCKRTKRNTAKGFPTSRIDSEEGENIPRKISEIDRQF